VPGSPEERIKELERELERVEQELKAYRKRAESYDRAAGFATKTAVRFWVTESLASSIERWFAALRKWRSEDDEAFPEAETANLVAAVIRRLTYVSAAGVLLTLVPSLLIVYQTSLLTEQNQIMERERRSSEASSRALREAQLLSTMYQRDSSCQESRNNGKCPLVAPCQARLQAVSAYRHLRCGKDDRIELSDLDVAGCSSIGHGWPATTSDNEAKPTTGCGRVALLRADFRDTDLHRASLNGIDLRGARLQGANLFKARLDGAYLYGANLNAARIDGAVLSDADLRGADMRVSSFADVDWDGALYDSATCWPSGFKPIASMRNYNDRSTWGDGYEPPEHSNGGRTLGEPLSPCAAATTK
jgi:hypothetical protein